MIIGVPKEIKNNENRVAVTPAGVKELGKHGHDIYVQSTAGNGSGFPDSDYEFKINEEKLYRMYTDNITMIL